MNVRPTALRIDFQREPARLAALPGFALLVVGALALGVSGLQYDGARGALAAAEARLAHLQKAAERGGPGAPVEDKTLAAALAQARDVNAELAMPWGALLGEFEAAAGEDVALLALSAEAKQGAVRASGEARSLKALTAYLRRLEASASLADVRLVGHETRAQQPGKPVIFALTARWEVQQ